MKNWIEIATKHATFQKIVADWSQLAQPPAERLASVVLLTGLKLNTTLTYPKEKS